jgi:hypothetical protein
MGTGLKSIEVDDIDARLRELEEAAEMKDGKHN